MLVRTFISISAVALLLAACTSAPTPGGDTTAFGAAPTGMPGMGDVKMTQSLPAPTFDQPPAAEAEYRLGALDAVAVSVFQVPELSGEFQVGSDGYLSLPLIGNIRATGRTVQEVQREVTAKLKASYLQTPQVTVRVTGFNSQKVVVDGSVAKPGTFPVASGGGTLLQYIAAAGGLPRTADAANVVIFRTVGTQRMMARFDVNDIRYGKMKDPIVYGGDTIVVPKSGIRSAWADVLQALPAASFVANVGGL